jgi:hypothetical protein
MATLLARASRTGRIESAPFNVLAGSSGRYVFMSDIDAVGLADANKFVDLHIDVQDAAVPGGWRFRWGATFQCGPVRRKDGSTNTAGENRGFESDAAEVAGRTIRGVVEIRDFAPTGPFGTLNIGVTATVVP